MSVITATETPAVSAEPVAEAPAPLSPAELSVGVAESLIDLGESQATGEALAVGYEAQYLGMVRSYRAAILGGATGDAIAKAVKAKADALKEEAKAEGVAIDATLPIFSMSSAGKLNVIATLADLLGKTKEGEDETPKGYCWRPAVGTFPAAAGIKSLHDAVMLATNPKGKETLVELAKSDPTLKVGKVRAVTPAIAAGESLADAVANVEGLTEVYRQKLSAHSKATKATTPLERLVRDMTTAGGKIQAALDEGLILDTSRAKQTDLADLLVMATDLLAQVGTAWVAVSDAAEAAAAAAAAAKAAAPAAEAEAEAEPTAEAPAEAEAEAKPAPKRRGRRSAV